MESPYLYWQYPGENVNRILGADDYSIRDDSPMFEYQGRKRYFISAKAVIEDNIPPRGDNVGSMYQENNIIECFTVGSFDAPIWDVNPDFSSRNVRWNITYTPAIGGNSHSGTCEKRTIRVSPFTRKKGVYSGTVTHGQESYKQPVIAKIIGGDFGKIGFFDWRVSVHSAATSRNCVNDIPWECELKIFKQGKVIYQRIENNCPEVWRPEIECPPGTCSVECGRHICCYDNQGYPVTSIPR